MKAAPQQVIGGLHALSEGLPGTVKLWVGGSNPALGRFHHPSVKALSLADVPGALAAWRPQPA